MVGLSATDLQAELAGEEELRFNMELYACAILVDSQEANVLCDASTACPCQCGRSGGALPNSGAKYSGSPPSVRLWIWNAPRQRCWIR